MRERNSRGIYLVNHFRPAVAGSDHGFIPQEMQTAARVYTLYSVRDDGRVLSSSAGCCSKGKINANGRAPATGFLSGLLCAYYAAHNSLATFTNRLNDVQIINCGKIPSHRSRPPYRGVSRVFLKKKPKKVGWRKKTTMACIYAH